MFLVLFWSNINILAVFRRYGDVRGPGGAQLAIEPKDDVTYDVGSLHETVSNFHTSLEP
jgi:hypothetical protein